MTITVDQYLANVRAGVYGKGVDMDGLYGYQCWDQAAHYAREVCGSTTAPYLKTYTGYAKDVYLHFGAINQDHFTRIANVSGDTSQLPQRGDLIVYNGNSGHIETVLEATAAGVTVVMHWGLTPSVGFQIIFRPWGNLPTLGWLRPKINVNQKPLEPYQRQVLSGGGPANGRSGPSLSSPVAQTLAEAQVGDFDAWTSNGDVNGNKIWFRGKYSKNWFSATVFTSGVVTGLPFVDTVTPFIPAGEVPEPTPLPQKPYTFEADLDVVTAVIPVHYSNRQVGNFPAAPTTAVLHDFGTKGLNTLQSVLNYFTADHTTQPNSQVSAHFVVSGESIIQMVSLSDRAWHAGSKGNDFVGIEIDPEVSSNSALAISTHESVLALLEALRDHYGKRLVNIKHSDLMATSCGDDIALARFVIDEASTDEPDHAPDNPPVPEPELPVEPLPLPTIPAMPDVPATKASGAIAFGVAAIIAAISLIGTVWAILSATN